jgi:hypothetical protein
LQEWEDDVIRELYPTSERLDLLRALPDRTFNVISQRAMALGIKRIVYSLRGIPISATFSDLEAIPDQDMSIKLITEACKAKQGAYSFWLYSADVNKFAEEVGVLRDLNRKDEAGLSRVGLK